jgi:hypothetical protein
MMTHEEQDTLLGTIAARLEPWGVVLVREADASAGCRFTAVWLAIRLQAVAFGAWRQPFHARTEMEWRACFGKHGFLVDTREMGQGTFHFTRYSPLGLGAPRKRLRKLDKTSRPVRPLSARRDRSLRIRSSACS